jgi:two-component system, sensor histidine kinase
MVNVVSESHGLQLTPFWRRWFGFVLPNPLLDDAQRDARYWAADITAAMSGLLLLLFAMINLLAGRWPWASFEIFKGFFLLTFVFYLMVWGLYRRLGRRESLLFFFFMVLLLATVVGFSVNGETATGSLLLGVVLARMLMPRHRAWWICLSAFSMTLIYWLGISHIDLERSALIYRVLAVTLVLFTVMDGVYSRASQGLAVSHLTGMRRLWLVTGVTTLCIWILGQLIDFPMNPVVVITFIGIALLWFAAERLLKPHIALFIVALVGFVMQSYQALNAGSLALPYTVLPVLAMSLAFPLGLFIIGTVAIVVLNSSLYIMHDYLNLDSLYARFVLCAFFCMPLAMLVHGFFVPSVMQPLTNMLRDNTCRQRFFKRTLLGLGAILILISPVLIAMPTESFLVRFMSSSISWFWWWSIALTVIMVSAILVIRIKRRQELSQLLVLAQQDNELKSMFVENMSHDIRTPMNGLLGMLQVLELDTSLSDQVAKRLTTIKQSSMQLLHLVDDISDIGRIERGELQIHVEPFDLSAWLIGQLDLQRQKALKAGVVLLIDRQIDIPCWVVGDAFRLGQILDNLVGNAIKFSPGGVVQIDLRFRSGIFELRVADDGIGMDKATLARIFNRFEQGDVGYTKRFQGLGLGLTIVSELLQLMGGELQADSTPGEGSVFKVCLPLPVAQPIDSVPSMPFSEPLLASLAVLVVDDDELNVLALEAMLSGAVAQVFKAQRGHEALECLAQHPIDVVIADIDMPEMNGEQLLHLVKQQYAVPVIAITGHVTTDELQCFQRIGFEVVLSKPLQRQHLLDTLARVGEGVVHA